MRAGADGTFGEGLGEFDGDFEKRCPADLGNGCCGATFCNIALDYEDYVDGYGFVDVDPNVGDVEIGQGQDGHGYEDVEVEE